MEDVYLTGGVCNEYEFYDCENMSTHFTAISYNNILLGNLLLY